MRYLVVVLCMLAVACAYADKCQHEHEICMKKAKYMKDKLACIRQRVKCIAGKLGEKVKPGQSCMQKCNQDNKNLMDRVKCYRTCVSVGDEMQMAEQLFDDADLTCREKEKKCMGAAKDYKEKFECLKGTLKCRMEKVQDRVKCMNKCRQKDNRQGMDCFRSCI
ncbi:uncharacterized protein [Clytia hemisphaerica]|uniref:Uncharacterized protein n=1 Tax=Clytia hemisphaerica TaxID=252671 RepID=A0A7M5XM59_9CNID|eukprot:TCONS_00027928-protein